MKPFRTDVELQERQETLTSYQMISPVLTTGGLLVYDNCDSVSLLCRENIDGLQVVLTDQHI
jgi:hypothetical protein